MTFPAIALIVAAAAWRMIGAQVPDLANFSPVMALAFCGGVYFRDRRMWLVPFAALAASDFFIDRYYAAQFHYAWTLGPAAVRLLCFAAGLAIGRVVSARRSWLALAGGALGSSILFFLVTNTVSWMGDAGYAGGAAGWWQAMTVGHPQYAPTFHFFRNTLVSDLAFTALFGLAMEHLAWRRGERSLLAPSAGALAKADR